MTAPLIVGAQEVLRQGPVSIGFQRVRWMSWERRYLLFMLPNEPAPRDCLLAPLHGMHRVHPSTLRHRGCSASPCLFHDTTRPFQDEEGAHHLTCIPRLHSCVPNRFHRHRAKEINGSWLARVHSLVGKLQARAVPSLPVTPVCALSCTHCTNYESTMILTAPPREQHRHDKLD